MEKLKGIITTSYYCGKQFIFILVRSASHWRQQSLCKSNRGRPELLLLLMRRWQDWTSGANAVAMHC